MPMDGFTLSFVNRELNTQILGGRVDKITQPSRDSLVLLIRTGINQRLLLSTNANQARVQITSARFENPIEPPMFCMLMRKHLLGARITQINQVNGDRILKIDFDTLNEMGDTVQKVLYLEIMGRYSNLTLVDENGMIIDCIRHVNREMSRIRTLLPGIPYVLPPQPPKLVMEYLTANELRAKLAHLKMPLYKALCDSVAGMAAICSKEICIQCGFDPSCPVDEMELDYVSQKLADFYCHLEEKPMVLTDDVGNTVDFFPFPYISYSAELQTEKATLSEAMDNYYQGRDLRLRMQQKSAGLQKQIKSNLERTYKKREKMEETLSKTKETEQNRIYGDLLTANLYLVPKGAEQVTVTNFYDSEGGDIIIPLSPKNSPNQNAQLYYKKYRKAKLAEDYAKKHLCEIMEEIALLEGALDDLNKCETTSDLSEIRFVLAEAGFLKKENSKASKNQKKPEGKPYRFVSEDGTVIEVGKNALQNDRLTLHARSGETWLHAQGIPGSHVIIRSEEPPADSTLLYAAKLATYFSKGKNHPQQAIDYTQRKYVKKSTGTPAGLVTYTHFKTLIIGLTPQDEAEIQRAASQFSM